MNPFEQARLLETRRQFLARGKNVLGMAALSSLLGESLFQGIASAAEAPAGASAGLGAGVGAGAAASILPHLPHFAPKAKNIIYLHMVGGPAQMDLYDHKPKMLEMYDKDLPESIRNGQRLTTMTSGQSRFPVAPSAFKFSAAGQCGLMMNTELLPYTAQCVDDMCFVRSMHTDAINHEPAIVEMQTGNMQTGRPCLGSWVSYGLGSLNKNLPTFVVMIATPTNREQEQAISQRLWSAGYLPGQYAGVPFRTQGDAILFINNPPGVSSSVRRKMLDGLHELNEMTAKEMGDAETQTRIQQYEMAFRMQASVPELTDMSKEGENTYKLYGEEAKKPGSFAYSALMARRLVERGVRFVQIYHNNWDHHGNLTGRMRPQCKDIDQATYGLIHDLKARGLFDETLIIWGGEFGRTIYSQGGLTHDNYGRDHHPRCFTMWMAGGGAKGGTIFGETDDFSYNIVRDPVHIRDFHATVLHLLGIDHERFTYKYQGLDQKLTGVEKAEVVKALLA